MAMTVEQRGGHGVGGRAGADLDELKLAQEDTSLLVTEVEEVEIPEDPETRVGPEGEAMVKEYLSLLLNESNLPHFVNIVRRKKAKDPVTDQEREVRTKITAGDLFAELRDPSVHMLAFKNAEGEPLGYTIIRDPSGGQHETWIERLVVKNKAQNKRRGDSAQPHVGSQILDKIKDWVFETPDFQGNARQSLYAGVVMFVPNWQRTDQFFQNNGFEFKARFPGNAEVIVNGHFMRRDTERFGYTRRDWERDQALKEVREARAAGTN